MTNRIAVGIDVGGTFTDVVLVDEERERIYSAKVLTTPSQPALGFLNAVEQVLDQAKVEHASIGKIVHGTTLATNAIIERKGARTALLTTSGFRDILETRNELKYDINDLFIEFPEPLIPRKWRLGITERIRFDGNVITEIKEDDVRDALARLADQGVEAVAVCFLHSYANSANEDVVESVAAEFPGCYVSLSSQVLPEIGEYGVDHVKVAEGLGCKAIRVTDPKNAQAAFTQARKWMKEFSVPVVVEFILERVTNISMGTEIDNVVEFEEVLDLPLDEVPAGKGNPRKLQPV